MAKPLSDPKVAQRPALDPESRIRAPHRTVDTLGKMLKAGTITPAMRDAGRTFQLDFALAGLDPIRARPMMVPCGGGRAPELAERQLDARRRVHRAVDLLGGLDSPAASAVWHILGCRCSVSEWALRRGWSGRPVRQEQAQGILVAALGILAGNYG